MTTNPALYRTPEERHRQELEYPSSNGERLAENDLQYIALTDTVDALRTRLADRPDVYVAGNMLVYYREGDASSRVAPDVFVAFGANGNHPRMSWLVWEEGLPPTFVLEVGSPSTWRRDAGVKRDIYARMGVAEYWRFDAMGNLFSPGLIGEELVDGTYHPLDVHADESRRPPRAQPDARRRPLRPRRQRTKAIRPRRRNVAAPLQGQEQDYRRASRRDRAASRTDGVPTPRTLITLSPAESAPRRALAPDANCSRLVIAVSHVITPTSPGLLPSPHIRATLSP